MHFTSCVASVFPVQISMLWPRENQGETEKRKRGEEARRKGNSLPGRRWKWPEPSVKASVKLTRTLPELILRTTFTWRPRSGRLYMFKSWSRLSLFSFSDIWRLSCPNFKVFRGDFSLFVYSIRETPELICVSDFFPLACRANAYLLELTYNFTFCRFLDES